MTQFCEWRDAPSGDFAVIGDPVSHSLSPRMHAAAFAARGEPYVYRAVRVASGEVAEALERLGSLGYRGVNVTVPHKAEARAAMREVDEFADRCDSVNTIRLSDLYGVNTDGGGFIDTIAGTISPTATVLILGAGGSARAIALSLALGGYNIRIFNRTPERASLLVRELSIAADVAESPVVGDAELVVNATSASLHGIALPVDFQGASQAIAYDLVYGDTPFLRQAREAGLRTMDGKELLVAQGARSIEFWLGGRAPRETMREAIA